MHLGCWQAPASAPGCGHLQGLQGWQVEDLVPQQRDRKRQERERTKTGGGGLKKMMEMKWRRSCGPKAAMKTMRVKVRGEAEEKILLLLCPVSRRRFRARMRTQAPINNKIRAQESRKDWR